MKTYTHPELIDDLLKHLSLINWCSFREIPMGSKWGDPHAPIADIYAFKKSYTRPFFSIYDIKVSRGDFLQDIKSSKYMKYMEFCDRFYFATPSGLVKVEEIPAEAGWYVRGDKGWRTIKPAPLRKTQPYADVLMACLFRGYRDFLAYRDLDKKISIHGNLRFIMPAKVLGKEISKMIEFYKWNESIIEKLKQLLEDRDIFSRWSTLDLLLENKEEFYQFIDKLERDKLDKSGDVC